MGRHAFVTGANRGIGLGIATRLAAAGYAVTAGTRSGRMPEVGVGSWPPGGTLTPVACDVTDADSVAAAFTTAEAANGPVEVLVANAGITRDQLLMRMPEEDFAAVIDTNLTGAWRCLRQVSTSMIRRRWGRVIFIGSAVGLHGSAGQTNYGASKAALVGLARSAARELSGRGITVNVVAPGLIESDMTAELSEDRRASYVTVVPAGRFGDASDIAAAVQFLAGDEAAYITGAVLPVDGGLGMGH